SSTCGRCDRGRRELPVGCQPLRGCRFLGSEVAPALPDNRLGGAGQDGWPSQARSGAAPGVHRQRINQTSHLTLHGLKDELAARGVKVSYDTVWKFLRREGLRFKKTLFPLEQARRYRPQGRRWRSFQVDLDPRRLVFIDET